LELTSAQQMRNADDTAIHVLGIPSTLLMRNAARALAKTAMAMMGDNFSAVVFCGSGNNGGDGVACASYLLLRGVRVRALLVGSREKMTADTREMERRLRELGGVLEDFDPAEPGLPEALDAAGVLIDALFGVGLSRPLTGKALEAVRLMNASRTPAVAADVPSGVQADTGAILGEAVRCQRTVTFSMAKPGHFTEPGCVCCGDVEVADIGIPAELLQECGCSVFTVTGEDVALPARPRLSHKGSFGKLLVLGGSLGYTGAPTLCARAGERAGAGLVYVGVPAAIYEITAVKNDGAMPFPLSCDGQGRLTLASLPVIEEKLKSCDVCVLGPGLGRSEELTELVRQLVSHSGKPLVLDADALFAVSQDPAALLRAERPLVLTPHEGEFARLYPQRSGDRIADARDFARQYDCVLVLKGHRTVVAFPDGTVHLPISGNPGMAVGGSGDVLAGVIGAFLGQLPLKQAVLWAVWLHGHAGDLCARRLGEWSMTAADLLETLPESIKEHTR